MARDDVPLIQPSESFASSPGVRSRMQKQRMRDTAPELALRRALHALGLRFRLDRQIVPGTRRRVDIVFVRAKVAVFVDGCFWHGCPDHTRAPKSNIEWWTNKIAGNKRRDAQTTSILQTGGWTVVRVWEHDDAESAARTIAAIVRDNRPDPNSSQREPNGERPKV